MLKAALEAQADGKLLVTSEQDFQSVGFQGRSGVESDVCYQIERVPTMRATMIPNVMQSVDIDVYNKQEEVGATLKAEQVTHAIKSVPADKCKCLTSWDCQSKRIFDENGVYPCLQAMDCGGANNTAVLKAEILDMTHANDVIKECGEVSPTLQARMGTGGNQIPLIFEPTYCIQGNTIDRSDTAGANGKGVIEGKSYTLNTVDRPAVAYAVGIQPNNSTSAGGLSDIEEKSPTLSCTKKTGVAACYPINTQIVTRSNKLGEGTGMGIGEDGDPAYTLQEAHSHGVIYAEPVSFENSSFGGYKQGVGTLKASGGDYGGGSENLICQPCSYNSSGDDSGINSTIVAKGSSAVCYGVVSKGNGEAFLSEERHTSLACGGGQAGQGYPCTLQSMDCDKLYVWIVRRLTPRECERLQGYPDDWALYDTKGNEIKDTPRYKACGNSIAIPCAVRVFQGIVEAERGA